jgi:hypothetical protein
MRTPRIVPEDNGSSIAPLVRAAIATGLGALDRNAPGKSRHEHAARRFGNDHALNLVLRAASQPATLAGNPVLAHVVVEYLKALTPISAGADLLTRGVGLNFNGAAQLNVPGIAIPTADFVAEGAPIPVVQAPTSAGTTLTPFKFAVISALTREIMESSNAETLVRQVLIESTGPALDKVLFSANAAGTDRPAGLLHSIAALTPAASTSGKFEAAASDLQALALAVAPVAGNGQVVLVGSPDATAAVRLRLPQPVDWPTLTSSSLAPRTVIMVATNALVSAVEGTPLIDAGTSAEIHFETVPAEIVTAGGVVAHPVGSVFQTDEVALRMRWPITWALRDTRGLAWMTSVNW